MILSEDSMGFRGVLGAILIVVATVGARGQWATPRGEVAFPDKTVVAVEIADTPALRQRGLMFREHLAPAEGMVFVFEAVGFYPFWMKNTLIPLDMIWVGPDRKVVSVAHSVPPCKADPCPNFSPTGDALYVVEVVGGFAKKHQLKAGDQLVFRNVPGPR
jgi:hypothetical protein